MTKSELHRLLKAHPESTIEELAWLTKQHPVEVYNRLWALSKMGFLNQRPKFGDVHVNLRYSSNMLDDKIVELIGRHPGKTIAELARLSKMESGHVASIICELVKLQRIERRREPDMRTAAAMQDPVKFALYRLTGKDTEHSAWRCYPVKSNASPQSLL